MKPMEKSNAPALENGLLILELLASRNEPVGFNEILGRLSVSKGSVVRLLKVLQEMGYIQKDVHSGRYITASRVNALIPSMAVKETFRRESVPFLESLVAKTHNTALAIYWTGHSLECLDKRINEASVPMQEIGSIFHDLDMAPWGWFIYDTLSTSAQKEMQLKMNRKKTFLHYYERWIAAFKKKGYTLDDQYLIPQLRRLGAPIYGPDDNLIGALGIGGNPLSLPIEMVDSYGALLCSYANELSMIVSGKR
jgi:DNA-binding IclR family transcriptional regulator